jgi:hypothetical protein
MRGTVLQYLVKSKSSGTEYLIEVYPTDDGPIITCTCPAGQNGQFCKHRFGLIKGEEHELVRSSHPVFDLQNMVSGRRLEVAINEMVKQERIFQQAQSRLRSVKKSVARIILGQS